MQKKNYCNVFDREIWLYTSGEMPAVRKKGWQRHINECKSCSAKLKALTGTLQNYRKIPAEGPDDITMEKILRQISRFRPKRWKKRAAMTIGIAACLFLGIILARHVDQTRRYQWDTDDLDSRIIKVAADIHLREENHWPWPVASNAVDDGFDEQIFNIKNRIEILQTQKNGDE